MTIDLYARAIALSSRMRSIHCCLWPGLTVLRCFLLHHTSVTSGTMYHTEDRCVHVHTVLLDCYRSTDGLHKGHEPTYGGDHARHVDSFTFLDQYLSTDSACNTVCP